jgi:soluble lytic murein transglycosylase
VQNCVAIGLMVLGEALAWAEDRSAEGEKLAQALKLVRAGRVDDALASVGKEVFLRDLVHWFVLTQGKPFGPFSEMRHFIALHSHWPKQDLLRACLESSLKVQVVLSAEDLRWLEAHPPQEGEAVLAYATQVRDKIPEEAFTKLIRSLWKRANFSVREERIFLLAFSSLLRPRDMVARADALLWKRQTTAAERLLPHVPEGERPLMEARIQLLKGDPKKTHCPPELLKNFRAAPSFVYAVLFLEHKQDKIKEAPALLQEIDFSKDEVHRSLWSTKVQYVARELIREKRFSEAYRLLAHAAAVFPAKEDASVDAQLLAGLIALQHLKQPQAALKYFTAAEQSESYRYRARALYWKARALECLKRKKEARKELERCMFYGNTFWGQLARTYLHKPVVFATLQKGSSSLRTDKNISSLLHAARLFTEAQEDLIAGQFTYLAGDSIKDAADVTYLLEETTKISLYLGIQTYIAHASRKLHTPCAFLYPCPPIEDILGKKPAVDNVLTWSIIRVESAFSERIVAPGNLGTGYMQLMTYTAEEVAQRHGFERSSFEKLLERDYNVLLGTTHLAELLERFNGCYPLVIAAYNAGIAAVERWLRNNGDPRVGEIDIVDWIEMIPYRITRLYVQKVLTDMQFYASLQKKKGFDLPTLLSRKGL